MKSAYFLPAGVLLALVFNASALADNGTLGDYFANISIETKIPRTSNRLHRQALESAIGRRAHLYCQQKGYRGMMAFYYEFQAEKWQYVLNDVICSNQPRIRHMVTAARVTIAKARIQRGDRVHRPLRDLMNRNRVADHLFNLMNEEQTIKPSSRRAQIRSQSTAHR